MDIRADRGLDYYVSTAFKTKLGSCKTGPYGKGFYEGKDLLDINAATVDLRILRRSGV
jgi:hypothetical protein